MTDHHVVVTLQHPHVAAVDIKGNFHRGLMIGVLLGYVLGVGTIAAAALLLEYLAH